MSCGGGKIFPVPFWVYDEGLQIKLTRDRLIGKSINILLILLFLYAQFEGCSSQKINEKPKEVFKPEGLHTILTKDSDCGEGTRQRRKGLGF